MTKLPTDTEVAESIKQFRQTLLDAGFRHANGAGELVSKDDTTWVGTQYANKEYSIYAWRRPTGHSELGEQRFVFRALVGTYDTDEGGRKPEQLYRVAKLGTRLARWAKKPPRGTNWPLPDLEPVR